MSMQISTAGIGFIKSYEELRLTAYDAGENDGILTIGYGHRDSTLKPGDTITEAEAEALLKTDLQIFVSAVNSSATLMLKQHQFDALVSFAFNLGGGIFTQGSSKYDPELIQAINAEDIASFSYNLAAYRKSGGNVFDGLVARRNDEIELYITGDYKRDYDYNDRLETGYYIGLKETTSVVNAVSTVGESDVNSLLKLVLESQIGRTVSDVQYSGAGNAAFLVSDFDISGVFDLKRGILLSTGGLPGSTNTSSSYTVSHGTPGDADLSATASAAFSGAGQTQDASVLEFNVNVKAGSAVDGIAFDIVFGSDEYPEYSNTSFVDVAAIYVNGVNVALFNDNQSTPLSVTQANVDAGNFINNTSGAYATEWDGFSKVLTVRAPIKVGENTIKIGVADTGDTAFDSGLYINNMKLLTGGATGGGVLNVVNGDSGNNVLFASLLKEEINLFGGVDVVEGTPAELNGDIITSFWTDDVLAFKGVVFAQHNLTVTLGSAILDIDTDDDGVKDTTVTLEGEYPGAFKVTASSSGDVVTYITYSENQAPTAADDTFNIDEDTTISGNVLLDNGNGADNDPDGDPLAVSLVSGPDEGILVLNSDGTFTYEADADAFDIATPGTENEQTFTYELSDGNGGTDQASATITVAILDDGETITGTNKPDDLTGTDGGEDTIKGGNGNDIIFGLDGADTLYGENGNDQLYGGESIDRLFGGNGNDLLDGGDGNDFLYGELGDDTLTGGLGKDQFWFGKSGGTDTITDFTVGEDLVCVSGIKNATSFAAVGITQVGANTVLDIGGTHAILSGIESSVLTADDFLFA